MSKKALRRIAETHKTFQNFFSEMIEKDREFWEEAWYLEILLTVYLTSFLFLAAVHGEWNVVFDWLRFAYYFLQELIFLGCVGKLLGVDWTYTYEGKPFIYGPNYFWGDYQK